MTEPRRPPLAGVRILANFPTRDGWIVILCNKDKFWQALLEKTGLEALRGDPRFATFSDRLAGYGARTIEALRAKGAIG